MTLRHLQVLCSDLYRFLEGEIPSRDIEASHQLGQHLLSAKTVWRTALSSK